MNNPPGNTEEPVKGKWVKKFYADMTFDGWLTFGNSGFFRHVATSESISNVDAFKWWCDNGFKGSPPPF